MRTPDTWPGTPRHHRAARRIGSALLLVALCLLAWHGPNAWAAPAGALASPLPADGDAPFTPVTTTSVVSAAIDQVSSTTLTQIIGDLSGEWPVEVAGETVTLSTRYSYADAALDLAETYALERFASLDLPATCHSYQLDPVTRCNIVAEQEGALVPERIVIVSAHLDSIVSVAGERYTYAPGADDNASGTAAVLTAAAILSQLEFPLTIRYVLFTGEEQGLYGSTAYADALATAGEQVVAVLNLDMIGYNNDEPGMDVHTRIGAAGATDIAIANVFSETVATYSMALVPELVPSATTGSDHASFWSAGYPAVLIIEDYIGDFNPAYHSEHDRLDQLDADYLTEMTRAVVATTMHLAGVIDFAAGPSVIAAARPITLSTVSHLPASIPVTVHWDFGDGGTAAGSVVTHTFSLAQKVAAGSSWPVTMTVEHPAGELQVTHSLPVWARDLFLPLVLKR